MPNTSYPLISIITATYNSGLVIERCIKSIIGQTYQNFEFIIIDGGSADNTIDIIKKYEGSIRWISEPDSGIYDAWNKGVKLAKGEWLTFLGSDDTFYPDALQNYVEFIEQAGKNDLEFVSSKMHLVNANDKIIRSLGLAWDWKICRLKNLIAHPGSLHHKDLFTKWGLYDTGYKICGDYEFLLRPGNDLKSAFMDKFTVRMAQGGISNNAKKLYDEHYRVATTTGKLNKVTATYYRAWHMWKSYVKVLIRKAGIDI